MSCPTCRTLFGDKEILYQEGLQKICEQNLDAIKKEIEVEKLLDSLYLKRYCCRMRVPNSISFVKLIK
jgi:DNA-directed RNA polymerase subunit N (RpoN/RPB10)